MKLFLKLSLACLLYKSITGTWDFVENHHVDHVERRTTEQETHDDDWLLTGKNDEKKPSYIKKFISNEMYINTTQINDAATGEIIAKANHYPPHPGLQNSVYFIPNGIVSFDLGGYRNVYSEDRVFIKGVSGEWYNAYSPLKAHNMSSTKEMVNISGDVIYLKVSCHYWHYQYETLVELLELRDAGVFSDLEKNKNKYTLLLDSDLNCGNNAKIYKEMREYYGFFLDDIKTVKINSKKVYHIENGSLIMTTKSIFTPHVFFSQYTAKLSSINNAKKSDISLTSDPFYVPSRLYIDREAGYTRGIMNRDELLRELEKFNVTLFSPASHSYTEQREAFENADLILSASGTAFSANIAHCNPNTTVLIEMFGKPLHTMTGVLVSQSIGAKKYFGVQPSYNRNATNGNFYVNVTMIHMVLEKALGKVKV